MGINVRVQKSPKPLEIIVAQANLERDLKSCMRCRFFCGNNSQCIAKKCVKEDTQPKAAEQEKEDKCFGCPYRQSEQYCFPCMKKLLGIEENVAVDDEVAVIPTAADKIECIADGKSTCRNEVIAEAFHYMRIVEAWGTGIPRIISRCKEYDLQEPLFEELGDGFLVTMFRKPTNQTDQSNQTNQLDQSNPVDIEQRQDIYIGDLENKIIELLKVQPGATTKEIVEKLEITNNQVKYYIKKLKDDGIIKRVGTNRKGSWKVI